MQLVWYENGCGWVRQTRRCGRAKFLTLVAHPRTAADFTKLPDRAGGAGELHSIGFACVTTFVKRCRRLLQSLDIIVISGST